MHSSKKIFKNNESPLQCLFKSGKADINQTQKYSNFLHTYFDADHTRNITDRQSVTSTTHIFNSTIVNCCSKKQTKTSWNSSNSETIEMYTGVLDQNWILILCRFISYTIGVPSKLYGDNQDTIKCVLSNIITPQE